LVVMYGYEGELKLRNLGITPHILVHHEADEAPGNTSTSARLQDFSQIPGVLAQAEQVDYEGLIQSSSALQGVLIQGVESQAMQQHSVIANNMLVGSLHNLIAGNYGVVIGHALARKLNLSIGEK